MKQETKDALTVKRYIDSCKTYKQTLVCREILSRFTAKYGRSEITRQLGFEHLNKSNELRIKDGCGPDYFLYLDYF